jgi:hypothetical protein
MYVVRGSKWFGKRGWSGKPDGMLLRADRSWTGHKENAALFATEQEANSAASSVQLWNAIDGMRWSSPLFVVEVTIRPVMTTPVRAILVGLGHKIKDRPWTGDAS